MKMIALSVLVSCSISGCATAPQDGTLQTREVLYTCTNGDAVAVRYSTPPDTALLLRNGAEIPLNQQASTSGFVYSNGPNTIRGNGNNLTVEIGRMMPIECVAN